MRLLSFKTANAAAFCQIIKPFVRLNHCYSRLLNNSENDSISPSNKKAHCHSVRVHCRCCDFLWVCSTRAWGSLNLTFSLDACGVRSRGNGFDERKAYKRARVVDCFSSLTTAQRHRSAEMGSVRTVPPFTTSQFAYIVCFFSYSTHQYALYGVAYSF